MTSAVCDACSATINKGGGYAFYSSAQMMGMTVGNMFLCEACTSSMVNEKAFSKRFAPTAVSPGDMAAMREAMNAANAAGIAERCRAHGLSADEGKAKARELARLYWRDPQGGGEAIKKFWTSPAAKAAGSSQASAKSPRSRERRWWEFWK